MFDIGRARRDLGYEPQFTLEAAVRDWTGWMQRLGLEPRPHQAEAGPAPASAAAAGT